MLVSGIPVVEANQVDPHVLERLEVVAALVTGAAGRRGVACAPDGRNGVVGDVAPEEDAGLVGGGGVVRFGEGFIAN